MRRREERTPDSLPLRTTRERDEPLEGAAVAAHAREAPREQATPEEGAELRLDEARHADAVGGRGRGGEKGLEVRAHHVVQHRRLGHPGLVPSADHAAGPCDARAGAPGPPA